MRQCCRTQHVMYDQTYAVPNHSININSIQCLNVLLSMKEKINSNFINTLVLVALRTQDYRDRMQLISIGPFDICKFNR